MDQAYCFLKYVICVSDLFFKKYQVTTIYLAFQCCIDMHIYRDGSIPKLESLLNTLLMQMLF